MIDELTLWGLFVSSFISSTLLPGGSEVLLGYLAAEAVHPPGVLVVIATLGNTLGGGITFALGWLGGVRWPVRGEEDRSKRRALVIIERYGVVALLFSWMPVIGDPLCLIAGWLRLNPLLSLLLICIGKALRYIVVVFVVV